MMLPTAGSCISTCQSSMVTAHQTAEKPKPAATAPHTRQPIRLSSEGLPHLFSFILLFWLVSRISVIFMTFPQGWSFGVFCCYLSGKNPEFLPEPFCLSGWGPGTLYFFESTLGPHWEHYKVLFKYHRLLSQWSPSVRPALPLGPGTPAGNGAHYRHSEGYFIKQSGRTWFQRPPSKKACFV